MSNLRTWAIPIALAVMLLLAATFGVSRYAQAQAPSPSLADMYGAINGDATDLNTDAIVSKVVANFPATGGAFVDYQRADTGVTPNVPQITSPTILNGPMFTPAGGTPEPIFVAGTTGTGDTTAVTVSLTSNAVTYFNDTANKSALRSSYSFQVAGKIDVDTTTDSNADTDTTPDNDPDVTVTSTVTINVLRIKENNLAFDVVPSKAVKGATVSGLRNPIETGPLQWELTGVGSSMKMSADIPALTGQAADFEVRETSAGSGIFRLYVKENGVASLTEAASNAQPHAVLRLYPSYLHLTRTSTPMGPTPTA